MTRYVCTLFTDSYLPQALTLWESVRAHTADWGFVALRIGRRELGRAVPEEFRRACIDAGSSGLGHPGARFWYEPFEYANAMKSALHRHLLARDDAAEWWYVDADCVFRASPDALADQGGRAPILLSPHRGRPIPGNPGWDVPLLRYGAWNGGLLGLRRAPEVSDFLAWYAERLTWLGFAEPRLGLYADQKWLDLAPTCFPCDIVDDPGLNVGYWRFSPDHAEGRAPVTLLHLSQVDLRGELPKLACDAPMDPPTRRAFLALAECYRERLLHWARVAGPQEPYPFACFDDGFPISKSMRRAYYCDVLDGVAPGDPFGAGSRYREVRAAAVERRFARRIDPLGNGAAETLGARDSVRRRDVDRMLAAIPVRRLLPGLLRRLLRRSGRG